MIIHSYTHVQIKYMYMYIVHESIHVNFRGRLTATKNKNTNKTKFEILLDENFQNYGTCTLYMKQYMYVCVLCASPHQHSLHTNLPLTSSNGVSHFLVRVCKY